MFGEIRARFPAMAPWMECCYGSQPLLHIGSHIIHSFCGVQQEEPLGPLGFALALHPVIEMIKREVPSLIVSAWYLDDGILCGSACDLEIIEEVGPAGGLFLNRGKSLLHIPTDCIPDCNPLPAEIPIARDGFDLLGSPIGPSSFCEATVLWRGG